MTEERRFLIITALLPEGGLTGASLIERDASVWSADDGRVRINGAFVCCADGGYAWARAAGIMPDAVVGDMDSLAPELLRELEDTGIATERHPREKDDTDTLLCVKYGLARGFSKFTILGGVGGEFAHTLANLQALSFLTDMECEAEILTGRERVFMLDGGTVKAGRPGAPPAADSAAQAAQSAQTAQAGPAPQAARLTPQSAQMEPALQAARLTPQSAQMELALQAARHEVLLTGAPGQRFSVFSYAERTSRVTLEGAVKYPLADAVLTQSYPIGLHNEFTAKAADGLAAGQARLRIGFGRVLVVVENRI